MQRVMKQGQVYFMKQAYAKSARQSYINHVRKSRSTEKSQWRKSFVEAVVKASEVESKKMSRQAFSCIACDSQTVWEHKGTCSECLSERTIHPQTQGA